MSTKVLLTLDNPSDYLKNDVEFFNEMPYGILLLEKRVGEKYTIEPKPEDIVRKEKNKTISPYDRVPHTHYSYEQSCIIYDTKEDLENNKGVYWDFIPDYADEMLDEYTAKLI